MAIIFGRRPPFLCGKREWARDEKNIPHLGMMMLDRMAVPAETQSGRKKKGWVGIYSPSSSQKGNHGHIQTHARKKERKKKRKGTNRNSPNIRGKKSFVLYTATKRLKSGIRLSPKFEINVPRSNLFFPAKRHYISFDEAGKRPCQFVELRANWDSEMRYHHHRRCQPLCPQIYLPINIRSVTLPSVSRSQK